MECFSYVVARDFGFAPNPFHGFCTLATCKPRIRNRANVGDWIIGFSPRCYAERKVLYIMNVTEKVDYDSYWTDARFQVKKPHMNASLIKYYGDNIYHRNGQNDNWIQADSHHSYENGVTNAYNLKRDTQSKFVLISTNFYYFGGNPVVLPNIINADPLFVKRNHRRISNETIFMPVIDWIQTNYTSNIIYSTPKLFDKSIRYNGLD